MIRNARDILTPVLGCVLLVLSGWGLHEAETLRQAETVAQAMRADEQPRSSHWPAKRAEWLRAHPTCAACGGAEGLQVHHILPVSWPGGRELELSDSNLITLCTAKGHNCHLWIGHLGDFKSRNPDVRADAAAMLRKIKARPYPWVETRSNQRSRGGSSRRCWSVRCLSF